MWIYRIQGKFGVIRSSLPFHVLDCRRLNFYQTRTRRCCVIKVMPCVSTISIFRNWYGWISLCVFVFVSQRQFVTFFYISFRNNCIGITASKIASLSGFYRAFGAYSSVISRIWEDRRATKARALRALSHWPFLKLFTNTLVSPLSASPHRSTATSASLPPLFLTRTATLAQEGNHHYCFR